MKILRDTDWNLIGIQGQDGFIFRHKIYDELLLVKKAKFVLTKEDIVFICDITSQNKLCVSKSSKSKLLLEQPTLKDIIDDGVALLRKFGYYVNKLTAIHNFN